MSYVTLPSNSGTDGFLDIFKGMFGKKKKEKKPKASSDDGIGSKLKKIAADTAKDTTDPSARPGGGGDGGGGGLSMGSIPSWAIYAGAGAAVLFIIWRNRK
mgnify:CR=1 FL=1